MIPIIFSYFPFPHRMSSRFILYPRLVSSDVLLHTDVFF
jgi:hypothetical protein